MPLSKQSIETLVDLVEIKLSYMQVSDRDDAREQLQLQRCLSELTAMTSKSDHGVGAIGMPRRRGRRPKYVSLEH